MKRLSFGASFIFSLSLASLSASFTGSVVGVIDGDTLEVLHNNHPERIRLNGIDCPEKGQAYGKKAKQAASELVFGCDGGILAIVPKTVTHVWVDAFP